MRPNRPNFQFISGTLLLSGTLLTGCGGGPLPKNANANCIAPAQITQDSLNTQTGEAFSNLPALTGLTGLIQAPNNDRWYAVTQAGAIYWFTNTPSANQLNLLLDMRSVVRNVGEMGMLSLAFHPNFANNHQLYITYNDNRQNGRVTLSRFLSDGTGAIDINSEQVILTVDKPANNHNGGQVAFGPDGMLYVSFGDGGGANDQYGNGQNLKARLGKVLRIDVTNSATYSIPADNPFVGNPNILPEIYAYGLRNPWRFSFDTATGDLWLADVGQNEVEEVDKIIKGGNYGWPIMEGTNCFQSATCSSTGLQLPVAEYTHAGGDCSITGGFVYHGTQSAALGGRYLYGDYCTGRLRSTKQDNAQHYLTQELMLSGLNISSFAQDHQGEVYALNYFGGAGKGIYHITADSNGTVTTIPAKLSDTGCFTNTATKTVAAGVAPYNVISPLWSDGEQKTRFLAIPTTQRIGVLPDGDFDFPVGTVLIKNFIYNNNYLETRLFMHHQTGWAGYSYEWLPDQSDATLVENGATLNINGFVHTIPSPGQCLECHTGAANYSLGVEASQLNSSYTYPSGGTGNQNSALFTASYLAAQVAPNQITPLVALTDSTASAELKARSYLHANCSGCHRPGGPGSQLDLRIQTTFANTHTCNAIPAAGDLGISNARIIAPGDPSRSVLLARMNRLDGNRMPPLATHLVDTAATGVISQWISGLTACP